MRCEDAQPLLAHLAAGALDEPLRAELERHIRQCGKCRREYRALLRVGELLERATPLAPPRDLWPEVAAQLTPHRPRRAPLVPRLALPRWALAAALAVLLALGGFGLWVGHKAAAPPIAHALDEDAPYFVRWNAEAHLASAFSDHAAWSLVLEAVPEPPRERQS